ALLQSMTPATAPPDQSAGTGVLPALAGLRQPTLIVLLGLLLVRTVLLFAGAGLLYAVGRAVDPTTTWDRMLLWSNVSIVVIDIITIALVAVALKRSGSGLGALLRTRTPGRDIAWGLLLSVITYVGFIVTSFIGNFAAYQAAPPITPSS